MFLLRCMSYTFNRLHSYIFSSTKRFMVYKGAVGQVFFLSISIFPCQCHSTNAPCSFSSKCCSYQKEKWSKHGNLPKSNSLSEIWENLVDKHFHFLQKLRHLLALCDCCQSCTMKYVLTVFHYVVFLFISVFSLL